jgi:hypothetical protein
MCRKKPFECIDAIFRLNTNNPDSFYVWLKLFPCVKSCEKIEEVIEIIENELLNETVRAM